MWSLHITADGWDNDTDDDEAADDAGLVLAGTSTLSLGDAHGGAAGGSSADDGDDDLEEEEDVELDDADLDKLDELENDPELAAYLQVGLWLNPKS